MMEASCSLATPKQPRHSDCWSLQLDRYFWVQLWPSKFFICLNLPSLVSYLDLTLCHEMTLVWYLPKMLHRASDAVAPRFHNPLCMLFQCPECWQCYLLCLCSISNEFLRSFCWVTLDLRWISPLTQIISLPLPTSSAAHSGRVSVSDQWEWCSRECLSLPTSLTHCQLFFQFCFSLLLDYHALSRYRIVCGLIRCSCCSDGCYFGKRL